MRSGKRVAKKKQGTRILPQKPRKEFVETKDSYLLRRLLIVILVVVVAARLYGYAIDTAKQSKNVQQCQTMLDNIFSFEIKAENWAEEKAIKQVVEEFNEEHGYKGTSYQYKMYKTQDGVYWITSDFVHDIEFEMKAQEYFNCIMDMSIGLRNEEELYIFEYMTEEQRLDYEKLSLGCRMMAQEIIDIHEERSIYGKVTFVTVTVKPKSNFVEESDIVSLSFLTKIILKVQKISVKIPINKLKKKGDFKECLTSYLWGHQILQKKV